MRTPAIFCVSVVASADTLVSAAAGWLLLTDRDTAPAVMAALAMASRAAGSAPTDADAAAVALATATAVSVSVRSRLSSSRPADQKLWWFLGGVLEACRSGIARR